MSEDPQPPTQRARQLDGYLGTVDRLEPELHPVDDTAALTSTAVSLRRVADGIDRLTKLMEMRAGVAPVLHGDTTAVKGAWQQAVADGFMTAEEAGASTEMPQKPAHGGISLAQYHALSVLIMLADTACDDKALHDLCLTWTATQVRETIVTAKEMQYLPIVDWAPTAGTEKPPVMNGRQWGIVRDLLTIAQANARGKTFPRDTIAPLLVLAEEAGLQKPWNAEAPHPDTPVVRAVTSLDLSRVQEHQSDMMPRSFGVALRNLVALYPDMDRTKLVHELEACAMDIRTECEISLGDDRLSDAEWELLQHVFSWMGNFPHFRAQCIAYLAGAGHDDAAAELGALQNRCF